MPKAGQPAGRREVSSPSLVAVALGHAWEWSQAVQLQLERFRRSGRVSDAYLLVIALRNVLRAAQLAREELVTVVGRAALDQAITTFEETLPGVKSARDALEHFDAYARGRGGTGKDRGTLGPYPVTVAGSGDRDESGWPGRLVLHIGPHPVDLTTASQAAAALVHAIHLAARAEE